MAFIPRTSKYYPSDMYHSPWYVSSGNWFWANNWYYEPPNGNCTWYAYGRYAEARGAFANLPLGNAGTWFDNATSFNRGFYNQGALPQVGCILCFKQSDNNPDFLGHVTVCEEVYPDGSILISNSGYSSTPSWSNPTDFWTAVVRPDDQYRQQWYYAGDRDYICQGFIYNDISPIPPPGPPPYVNKPMPLWFYLRRL